jgi:hypothetical protein
VLADPVRSISDLERRGEDVERWRRFAADVALTTPEHRFLFDLRTGNARLYDRALDPDERFDLTTRRPDLARAFMSRLSRWQRNEAQRIVCDLRQAQSAR